MNKNKEILMYWVIFALIIVIAGIIITAMYNRKIYMKEKLNTDVSSTNVSQDTYNKDIRKAVKVEGKIYYDTGRKSNALRCGMMDGKITSNVETNQIPMIDNQANFEGEYDFQYGKENTIEILINNEWCIFENEEKEEDSFYGKVIESSQKYIIVEPNEGEEIRKSADKISVGLGNNNDAIYKVGTNVKVIYTGYVMESYPAQVNAVNIELKSVENFEIKFYDKHPQNYTKIQRILDKSETDNYDYNIHSYDGSVNIIINGEETSLRNALLENKITMDEIIAEANADLKDKRITGSEYDDGGSIEYKYNLYTIIKCHKLDGNRDVYIGGPNLNINYLNL